MSVLPPSVTTRPLVKPPRKRPATLISEPEAQTTTVQLFTDFAESREIIRISPNCAFPIELGSSTTPILHIPASPLHVIFWNKNQLVVTLEIVNTETEKPITTAEKIDIAPPNHVIASLFSQMFV